MRTLLVALLALTGSSCDSRALPDRHPLPPELPSHRTILVEARPNAIDLLFVIDNSGGTEQRQVNLIQAFPKLLRSLEHPAYGGLPDLHIGVVTTDLGAGNYSLSSCRVAGGDLGRLQTEPRVAGCSPPSGAWIAHRDGKVNVPCSDGGAKDCIADAFRCIAYVGMQGCGFQMPLESARRALDPKLNINSGFLRPEATLVLVFVGDEDDCSARNPQLFDPSQQATTDPLGPLTTFRCFEFGVQCDINDRNVVGPRKNCKPAFDWLYKVEDYVKFFRGLKQHKSRVLVSLIAGPPTPVEVGKDGKNPTLRPSCEGTSGYALPAIRLDAVRAAFDGTFTSACDPAGYARALAQVGERIHTGGPAGCLARLPVTRTGSLACDASLVGCEGASCLGDVDCSAESARFAVTAVEERVGLPRCPAGLFSDPEQHDCGSACPCWRIVPDTTCGGSGGPPLRLEVLRAAPPPPDTTTFLRCRVATFGWGSDEMAKARICR